MNKKTIDLDSKRIKVLHVLSSRRYSGAENVACTIIKTLSNKYDFAYCSPKGSIKESLKEKRIRFIPVVKLNYTELKKVIDSYKPTIIHAHDFKASLLASLFYKRCAIISHIHKNDPQMRKISLKSILFARVSKRFSKIIGVSDSIFKEYIYKDVIRAKYTSIPNYVDEDEVIKKANEYKVEKKYDLFFIGRLSKEKNPIEFIEIVRSLNNKNIKCVMIGDGPLRQECEELIDHYNLSGQIEMVGFLSNPYPYIKASRIGIMPSIYEGYGITAIEATILGKPVINSGVGGLKSIYRGTKLIAKNRDEYKQIYENRNMELPTKATLISKESYINACQVLYEDIIIKNEQK